MRVNKICTLSGSGSGSGQIGHQLSGNSWMLKIAMWYTPNYCKTNDIFCETNSATQLARVEFHSTPHTWNVLNRCTTACSVSDLSVVQIQTYKVATITLKIYSSGTLVYFSSSVKRSSPSYYVQTQTSCCRNWY